jgi:endonuclease G, mitochondrial
MNKLPVPALLVLVIICALIGVYLTWGSPSSDHQETVPSQQQIAEPLSSEEKQTGQIPAKIKSDFCLEGCPLGASPADQLVIHHIYELENNPETKFADWVAYKISSQTLGSGCKRIWEKDPALPSDSTLSPPDYVGARKALGTDRGHQAPLASLCGSPYWQEADYLSNITPQQSMLNEGTWERLENAERKLITENEVDTVYSITGPLYERPMPSLPRSHLEEKTPSGYWKLVSFKKDNQIYAAAFIMDQTLDRNANFCDTAVELPELVKRTQLTFFSELKSANDSGVSLHNHELLGILHCL